MNKYFLLIFTLFFVSLVRAAHRDPARLLAARLLLGTDLGVQDHPDVEVYVGPETPPVGFGPESPLADLAGPESPLGYGYFGILESPLAGSLGLDSPVGFRLGSPLASLDGLELVNPADQAAGAGSEMQQLASPKQKAAASGGAQGLKSRVVSTAFSGYNGQQPEKKQQPKKNQPPKKKQPSCARRTMRSYNDDKRRQQVQDEERCLAGRAAGVLRRRAALVKEGYTPQDAEEIEKSDRKAVAKPLAKRAAERVAEREEKK